MGSDTFLINMQFKKNIPIVLIIFACLFSYFNTLFALFVWDDYSLIVDNSYMHSFKFLPKYFLQDILQVSIHAMSSGYYRPLLAASFILDYTLWGIKPFGYHLTNLIFHILVSILVFLFIQMLSKDRLISFASALLFSVHPIHTESVSFISGRVDVLPLAFLLLSLILFLKYVSNNKFTPLESLVPLQSSFLTGFIFYLLSLLCFFISLLTKEMAITLPLLVLVMDYLFISQRRIKDVLKNIPRFHLGFFAVLGLYFAIRFYTIGWSFFIAKQYYAAHFPPGTTPYWRIFTAIKLLTFYIRLIFFPYGLKVDYFFSPANSLFEPVVFLGLAILSFFIFVALKNLKKYPILSFSILWFFITVLPVSNIFPLGNIFAERYMYIPSVGFCMAIGFLFSWLLKKDIKTDYLNWKISIYFVFFLLVIALGRVTFERNKVWNNEFSLWYETAKAAPNSVGAHINLAHAYNTLNLLDEAINELRAVQLDHPLYYKVLGTLGEIYIKKGWIDKAIEAYRIAIESVPTEAVAYNGLAVAYSKKGQYKEAIEADLMALKINPYLNEARYDLALNYSIIGLIDEAIKTYEEYLSTNSDNIDAQVDVGRLYYKKGDCQKAREHWLKALKISKDYKPAKDALNSLCQSQEF